MKRGTSKASRKLTGIQYAALPWRLRGGEVQVLLVTSRRTRRWIVPKGWPMDGRKPFECAAREAEEEAGISGPIEKSATGQYVYMKVLRDGSEMPCHVEVFAMEVVKERPTWDEMDARERRWCSAQEAADAVLEPQLGMIIRRFASTITTKQRKPAR